jgi:hypothetical protein
VTYIIIKERIKVGEIVKLEDFFEFDKNEPVNRVAYTKEDVEYKVKAINKMKEIGITEITMDEARKYLWNYCFRK